MVLTIWAVITAIVLIATHYIGRSVPDTPTNRFMKVILNGLTIFYAVIISLIVITAVQEKEPKNQLKTPVSAESLRSYETPQ